MTDDKDFVLELMDVEEVDGGLQLSLAMDKDTRALLIDAAQEFYSTEAFKIDELIDFVPDDVDINSDEALLCMYLGFIIEVLSGDR